MKVIKCSLIVRLNIVKISILPKANHRFSEIPIKISVAFFTEIEQTILKCAQNQKRL